MESTHQDYVSSLPVSIAGKSADIKYIDLLPSIQAKYSFDNKKALRFSYFKSIYRPAFSDLIPYGERNSSGFCRKNIQWYIAIPVIRAGYLNTIYKSSIIPKKSLEKISNGGH